jgi:diguanylate cyclase (GGDEF)-like protein/PAS domain S-box-containing protein
MPLRRALTRLSNAAVLTLAGGLLATGALFVAVSHLEYDKMELGFRQRAEVRIAAINKALDEAVEVATVTTSLFTAVNPATRSQFHDFTAPLLERYPYIKAFNFHRLVPGPERAAAERAMQAIVPGTVFRELSNGSLRVAPERPLYHVVDYLEPMKGNIAAFGLNVSVNAQVAAALDQAGSSGKVTSTGLLALAQDGGVPQRSFEVMLPVFKRGMPIDTVEQRRAALLGDIAAIIRANELVQQTLIRAALLSDTSVALQVYASDQVDASNLIFESGDRSVVDAPPGLSQRFAAWLDSDYRGQLTRTLSVAGRPWHVRALAAPRPFLSDHLGSLSVLVGGVMVTLMLAALAQVSVVRTRRIHALVAERTSDLLRSNERLVEDVLARKRTEKALQDSEQRFRQLVQLSSDWYWEQDAELRFTAITGGGIDKTGMPADSLIGKTRWEAVPGMLETDWGNAHRQTLEAREPFTGFEYSVPDAEGNMRWFVINGEPVFDDGGAFCGYRGTGSDITARKTSEQRIHHVAQHDVLTGLPNRSLLQDRLSQAVAYSQRTGKQVWVLLVDLDRFKFVNDSMGHKAGDVLLMTVAARLRSALRETDTVARLSGDEFVVILSEHEGERLTVDIVQRLMETVAQPVMLGIKEFFVTTSIGVAVYPTDGAPADSLIEHADIAMYRAKKLGRNNFQFYTPSMNEEALERVRIEGALRNALERNELVLHYQPQVDLDSGMVVGMEALLRWQHPELGMVAPNRFIGVAEETGLIVPIGAWVLRSACAQAKAWHQAGFNKLRVAVNLSARQFASPELISEIETVLADTGLPPDSLEIELTESLFMSDVTQAVELMHKMKGLGINLSIDDFGTGYSSLSYLSRFPIDVLKIDRSFVNDISDDVNDAAIVASIIALAHNLKLAVIAEGVETPEQLRYLRHHGCDEMQGYYFSKPLAAHDFEALLRQHKQLPLPESVAA